MLPDLYVDSLTSEQLVVPNDIPGLPTGADTYMPGFVNLSVGDLQVFRYSDDEKQCAQVASVKCKFFFSSTQNLFFFVYFHLFVCLTKAISLT